RRRLWIWRMKELEERKKQLIDAKGKSEEHIQVLMAIDNKKKIEQLKRKVKEFKKKRKEGTKDEERKNCLECLPNLPKFNRKTTLLQAF
ncbi:hypothetical protein RUND412_009213, partial [Rhizina undulata]